jgi:hypothetical protein
LNVRAPRLQYEPLPDDPSIRGNSGRDSPPAQDLLSKLQVQLAAAAQLQAQPVRRRSSMELATSPVVQQQQQPQMQMLQQQQLQQQQQQQQRTILSPRARAMTPTFAPGTAGGTYARRPLSATETSDMLDEPQPLTLSPRSASSASGLSAANMQSDAAFRRADTIVLTAMANPTRATATAAASSALRASTGATDPPMRRTSGGGYGNSNAQALDVSKMTDKERRLLAMIIGDEDE